MENVDDSTFEITTSLNKDILIAFIEECNKRNISLRNYLENILTKQGIKLIRLKRKQNKPPVMPKKPEPKQDEDEDGNGIPF